MSDHPAAKAIKSYNRNNIATRFKSGPKQVEIARKGGQTVTLKQKYSARLREMKKRAAKGTWKNTDEEFFLQRLTDPEADIFYLQEWIEDIRKVAKTPGQLTGLLSAASQIHKLKFGEKRLNMNVNVNVDVELDEVEKHLNKLLGGE